VLALVCDSTNVFNPKASGSEGAVRTALKEEVAKHKGKRVVVTTFASNVARLQTLGEVAEATNRRLCVAGRSLDRIIRTAQASGYLKNLPDGSILIPRWPPARRSFDRRDWRAGRAPRGAGTYLRGQPPACP
jgi:mRNA degradation ribonuclease J1/J2